MTPQVGPSMIGEVNGRGVAEQKMLPCRFLLFRSPATGFPQPSVRQRHLGA